MYAALDALNKGVVVGGFHPKGEVRAWCKSILCSSCMVSISHPYDTRVITQTSPSCSTSLDPSLPPLRHIAEVVGEEGTVPATMVEI